MSQSVQIRSRLHAAAISLVALSAAFSLGRRSASSTAKEAAGLFGSSRLTASDNTGVCSVSDNVEPMTSRAPQDDIENDEATNATKTPDRRDDDADTTTALASYLDRNVQVYQSGPARIQVYDGLLSQSECDQIIQVGLAQLSEPPAQQKDRGNIHGVGYRVTYFDWPPGTNATTTMNHNNNARTTTTTTTAASYETVGKLWDRVLKLTHMSKSRYETRMQFAASSLVSEPPSLTNVHHDKNKRTTRTMTALTYLNDMAEGLGGETIFPCFSGSTDDGNGNGNDGPATASAASACRQLIWGHMQNHTVLKREGEHAFAPSALAAVERACSADDDNYRTNLQGMLRVQPKCGRVVVFPSSYMDGTDVVETWHTGCPVKVDTAVKYATQLFREPPSDPEKKDHVLSIFARSG